MEFKTTLEIVTKDIQDIEKLVGNFKNYSRIPNIELDLALARLRNVYDLLLMFRDESYADLHKPAHIKGENELLPEPEVSNVLTPDPMPDDTDYTGEIVVPVVEPEVSYRKTLIEPAGLSADGTVGIPIPAPDVPEKQELRKKTDEQKLYIHEKLGEHKHKKDITSKLQNQAIKSIAGSLGINDKFFFIRELFAGNSETFRQTMEELDDARNFNDAYSLLTGKFQWDMDSEPVQMLLNLIRRKFITSGNE